MKETLLLLFLKDGVTNNFISYQKDHSPVKGNLNYSCNIKKKKKIGTDYFTFAFSQSKSEPKLFHNYAKFSEFISLVRSVRRVSKKRTYTIITRLCASYNTQCFVKNRNDCVTMSIDLVKV